MPQLVAAEVITALTEAGVALTATEAAIVSAVVVTAVTIEMSVGLSLIEQAIQGSPERPKPPHGRRENIRQAIAPRVKGYGRVKAGGPFKVRRSA
jgi:hypothetical protein